MTFQLHPNFRDKIFLIDFPLCRILLENEKHYPWLILVPRKNDWVSLLDVPESEESRLYKELRIVQSVLVSEFHPDRVNVASIGNKTPRLHIHVIGRRENDPAWPGTVWDHPVRAPYEEEEKYRLVSRLQELLTNFV